VAEVTTSLSNILKTQHNFNHPKKIGVKQIHLKQEIEGESEEQDTTHLLHQAEEKLKQAEVLANQMIEEANKRIAEAQELFDQEKIKVMEQVKQEAYQIGFEEGKTEAEETYRKYINEGASIIRLAEKERDDIVEKSEELILSIAMKSTEKILTYELDKENNAFHTLVLSAIKDAKDQPKVEVYVHPNDFGKLQHFKAELETALENLADLRIYPNDQLERYSCIIETPVGQIDASIDVQLDELKTKLKGLLEEAR
jgi:flagellar assembly protein FliH